MADLYDLLLSLIKNSVPLNQSFYDSINISLPQSDPREQIRGAYNKILTDRHIGITSAADLNHETFEKVMEAFQKTVRARDIQYEQAELYQDCKVLAIYLGRVYEELQNIKGLFEWRTDMASFESFAVFYLTEEYLGESASQIRRILRSSIADYVISTAYEPKKEVSGFVPIRGYLHSTGSAVLDGLEMFRALFSPSELAKRGYIITTGEIVASGPGYIESVEEATISRRVLANITDKIYLQPTEGISPFVVGEHYSRNGVTWFNRYPITFFLDQDILKYDQETDPVKKQQIAREAQAKFCISEISIRSDAPWQFIKACFTPRSKVTKEMTERFPYLHFYAREDHGCVSQQLIYVDNELKDFTAILNP